MKPSPTYISCAFRNALKRSCLLTMKMAKAASPVKIALRADQNVPHSNGVVNDILNPRPA